MEKEDVQRLLELPPETIKQLYDGVSEQLKGKVLEHSQLVDQCGNDLGDLASVLVRFFNNLRSNENLSNELSTLRTKSALDKREIYQAYLDAGFNRQEAIQLLTTPVNISFPMSLPSKSSP